MVSKATRELHFFAEEPGIQKKGKASSCQLYFGFVIFALYFDADKSTINTFSVFVAKHIHFKLKKFCLKRFNEGEEKI